MSDLGFAGRLGVSRRMSIAGQVHYVSASKILEINNGEGSVARLLFWLLMDRTL